MDNIKVEDCVGNELSIGDEVVVLSSGNSSYRKGTVTGFSEKWTGHIKIQVEYNDHYYCNLPHYELKKKEQIKFFKKPIRVSVDRHNVTKLLPEYL
jgi:hypothetical protein